MRRNLVLLAFCFLVWTGVASAQTVVFNVGTAPTFVANTGLAEVLGQETNTADATCGTAADGLCVSTAGTIQILFQGVQIDNNKATANIGTVNTNGIEVCENFAGVITCNAAGVYLNGAPTVSNSTAGGVVSFPVKGGIDFAAGDQVYIRGVRGRIALSSAVVPGTDVQGKLNASPSTIASFSPTAQTVATSADPLTVIIDAANIAQCLYTGIATVEVDEGFPTAWVDHGDVADTSWPGQPLNQRPLFIGADGKTIANSRIHVVVTSLPTGVTISWPATSAADSGVGGTTAILTLVSQSTSGDNATYVYGTPDQANSDNFIEKFVVTLVANNGLPGTNIFLSQTPADFGTAYGQAQMYPPATPATVEVRYSHPLENVPPDPLIVVAPCRTDLLFPWVALLPSLGYDTGIAIANTSTDPFGLVGAVNQNGTCTLYGWSTTTPPTPETTPIPVTYTTPNIATSKTWANSLSQIGAFNTANFTGYIIAVCNFQYAHGFAYLSDNLTAANGVTQGYVALIIPDPNVIGARNATVTTNVPQQGEGLTQ